MTRNRVEVPRGGGGDKRGSVDNLPYYSVGTGTLTPAVKRSGREADSLPPFMPSWLWEDINTQCVTGTLARSFLIFDPMF